MRISDWSSDVCSSDLFDDGLLEQLLEDKVPASAEIYEQLSKDLADDLIVPVLFGSAEQGHGITRLWKTLRHETPDRSEEHPSELQSLMRNSYAVFCLKKTLSSVSEPTPHNPTHDPI